MPERGRRGDGPKAIFNDAVVWLLKRGVFLPGVTTLARLVAQVRDEATQRLWDTLSQRLTPKQRQMLERLLDVPRRGSLLGPGALAQGTGRAHHSQNLERALTRVSEIGAVGLGALELDSVPHRRLVDLARYGMAAKAPQLRRHPPSRRLATLAATVAYLEAKSIDDVLELFDLLMVTELLGKAEREATKEKVRQYPRLARASAKLAAAVEVLLEATSRGEDGVDVRRGGAQRGGMSGCGCGSGHMAGDGSGMLAVVARPCSTDPRRCSEPICLSEGCPNGVIELVDGHGGRAPTRDITPDTSQPHRRRAQAIARSLASTDLAHGATCGCMGSVTVWDPTRTGGRDGRATGVPLPAAQGGQQR